MFCQFVGGGLAEGRPSGLADGPCEVAPSVACGSSAKAGECRDNNYEHLAPGQDREPIRLGALLPLTPPGWVEAGRHLLAGLELAAHDVNAAGVVTRRPVELLVRDTAADPQRAVDAMDDLARAGVVAVAGE